MDDARFRELLGVGPEATIEEIRRAWRRRVMENHPDRFPAERKSFQELRVVTLTEAYAFLMALAREPSLAMEAPCAEAGRPAAGPANAAKSASGRRAAGARAAAACADRSSTAVGMHKDPAYAWYKQGFLHFSMAVHGIAELNVDLAKGKQASFKPRYQAARDFAASLRLLADAHGYFARVVGRYPESVWGADAGFKLKRIERFTRLYRKILANLGTTADVSQTEAENSTRA